MAYTFSRENAAEILGISTRTVDRYIKRGKISYKKVGNKILLNKEEVILLKAEFDLLQKEDTGSEIIQESGYKSNNTIVEQLEGSVEQRIENKIEKFFTIFHEKEKVIHEKDAMIFVLQQKIGELESKVSSMIALPDYSREKQSMISEKQKLTDAMQILENDIKKEKTTNTIYLGLLLIIVFIMLLVLFSFSGSL